MTTNKTLYKVDTKGKVRMWRMEVDGNKIRTISGIDGGKVVTSGWTVTTPKNVGRSNATTAEEQAIAEVEAKYKLKLEGDYHSSIKNAEGGNRHIKPMLAFDWNKVKDKSQLKYPVFVQPKLDGIRCLATATGLWSRTGKEIVAVPHISAALASFFEENPDAILDGELYNHEFKDDFNTIISMVRKTKPSEEDIELAREKVEYHVYDVASSEETFKKRCGEYKRGVRSINSSCVVPVATHAATTEEEIDTLYGEFLEDGYEGGIVRLDSPYELGKRSKSLLKRKDFEDKEFKIVEIQEGKGNWSGYAKVVLFELEDGRTCGAGLAGTQEFTKEVLEKRDEYVGKQVTVQYFTRTPDGVPRFPIAKALHLKRRW